MPVLPGPGSASPTSTPGLDMSGDGLSPLGAPGSGASVQNGSMTAARTPGWAFCTRWSVPLPSAARLTVEFLLGSPSYPTRWRNRPARELHFALAARCAP